MEEEIKKPKQPKQPTKRRIKKSTIRWVAGDFWVKFD
jgi:hypothetical protein